MSVQNSSKDSKYRFETSSSCSSSSSSEDKLYHPSMHMRPTELLQTANRREARLFRSKNKNLRRIVLLDRLIGRLEYHVKQCQKIRMSRKRRAAPRTEDEKRAKFEPTEEPEPTFTENTIDLKDRCKMIGVLGILGAR